MAKTKLSVNLNKVALLRNQRDCGYPSVLETAKTVIQAGAHGITVHPRPDERHIRRSDVEELSEFVQSQIEQGQKIEFNIEGYPTLEFIGMVCTVPCHQVTLVPDLPDQKTSDHGWNIAENIKYLRKVVTDIQACGPRVSLFIDPSPEMAKLAAETGAKRVELYTGPYFDKSIPLKDYQTTAFEAARCGLEVNAGHDLNLDNLEEFSKAIPDCAEVSIGHAITSDALNLGWPAAVRAYLKALGYR